MDFEISEDQELLRKGLRELLERHCDIRHVRALAYDDSGRDPDLWRALADAGWTAAAVPEADGGGGLRFEDVALVIEEAGRALLPPPLTTTLLASRAASRAPVSARRGELLSRIVGGSAAFTLALQASPEAPGCVAQRDGPGWRLSGTHAFVPYGRNADLVLLETALPDAGRALFVVSTNADGVAWEDLDTMDRTAPLYEMTLDSVVCGPEDCLFGGEDASGEIERLLDEWRAGLAAESLGVGERLLELTIAYAKERVQFGRPIGANQAVKSRLAEMGAAVERMRAAVYHAAVKIDAEAEDRTLAAAMAKAATAEPGAFVGGQAIHVHGGIGYTWEHDLHLYFKRIKSNELLLGDGIASLERVAEAVL